MAANPEFGAEAPTGAEVGFIRRFRLADEERIAAMTRSEAWSLIEGFLDAPIDDGKMKFLVEGGMAYAEEPNVSGKEFLGRSACLGMLEGTKEAAVTVADVKNAAGRDGGAGPADALPEFSM